MDEFVKEIFDYMIKILPADWGKIILRVFVGPNSQSVYFFVQDTASKKYYSYVDLQKMGVFSKQEFQDIAIKIGKASRDYQKSFEKAWTGYTLVIMRDGKTEIDLEYGEPEIIIRDSWKDKYLN